MQSLLIFFILLLNISIVYSSECLNRGTLSANYCDNDYDFLADPPVNAKEWINPEILIFSYIDPESKDNFSYNFTTFIAYLESCLQREVGFYQMKSNLAGIYAMQNGRAHIAGFSTGSTVFAVNQAGAIPFATRSYVDPSYNNRLLVITHKDSPYQGISDLKNKDIAHSNEYSFTGHLATFSLFPPEGLIPNIDYEILFSGTHERSIAGVKYGTYDAAVISSEALSRMISSNEVQEIDFKIIYQSQSFNSDSFSYAHNLTPTLKNEIKQCFYNYNFPEEMQKRLLGSQYFIPVDYQKDWAEIIKMIPFPDE